MMEPLLYSPGGKSENLQDSHVNNTGRENIIRVPVRKYDHGKHQFTIMACKNMNIPRGVFYELAVQSELGVNFLPTKYNVDRMMSQLLEESPITLEQYIKTEQKLLRKCARKMRRDFIKKIKKDLQTKTLLETFKKYVKKRRGECKKSLMVQDDTVQHETSDFEAKVTESALVAADIHKDKKIVMDDDKSIVLVDNDDDCLGGIMGIYSRSNIHGEYNGVVASAGTIG